MNFYIEVFCVVYSSNGITFLFISYLDWWKKMEWKGMKCNAAMFVVWISKRVRVGYNGK